jgi:hypothetical protein
MVRSTSIFLIVVALLLSGCSGVASSKHQASNLPWNISYKRPIAPGSLNSIAQDGAISLTWTLSVQAKSLPLILYRWQSGGLPVEIAKLPPDQTTFTDTGLINGTMYFYLLVTSNQDSVTSSCEAMAFATPTSPPMQEQSSLSGNNISSGGGGSNASSTFSYGSFQNLVSLVQITCSECGGSGQVPGDPNSVPFNQTPPPKTCFVCKGKGIVLLATSIDGARWLIPID